MCVCVCPPTLQTRVCYKSQRTPEPSCNGQPVTASHHLIGQSASVCKSRHASDPQASMIRAICYSALHSVYYSPVIKLGLCRSGHHLVSLLDSELYTQITKKMPCQKCKKSLHFASAITETFFKKIIMNLSLVVEKQINSIRHVARSTHLPRPLT